MVYLEQFGQVKVIAIKENGWREEAAAFSVRKRIACSMVNKVCTAIFCNIQENFCDKGGRGGGGGAWAFANSTMALYNETKTIYKIYITGDRYKYAKISNALAYILGIQMVTR